MKNDTLTFNEANRLFTYDPFTGELRWSDNENDLNGYAPSTISRLKGKPITVKVGRKKSPRIAVMVNGKQIYVHRIAWLLCWEKWPNSEIDHKDGDGTNNRIENLKDVAKITNSRNLRLQSRSTSGVTGVRLTKYGTYVARIRVDGKLIYLGTFKTLEDAAAARKKADEKYCFHPNHGSVR